MQKDKTKIFYLFSDVERRRRVLSSLGLKSGENYILWGMDEFKRLGFAVESNLDLGLIPSRFSAYLGNCFNKTWHTLGGYGGDFAAVGKAISRMNQADMIVATADRMGIPLVFFKMMGLIKPKIIYVSTGLPERLAKLHGPFFKSLFRRAFQHVEKVICYGWGEMEILKNWMGAEGQKVLFMPMGVDETIFKPIPNVSPDVDVLSIGRDPNRNFALLLQYAQENPTITIRIIAKKGQVNRAHQTPRNVEILEDVAFAEIKVHIAAARLVALPLHENSYSGATTTLLQAMAMAKPVVVTQTSAIKNGYFLENNKNIVLVKPGDSLNFAQIINHLLSSKKQANLIGRKARETVIKKLSWTNYLNNLRRVVDSIS